MGFKVGDRVRFIHDGEEGTIQGEVEGNLVDVMWDDDVMAEVHVGDLELVEDQPNRTNYKQDAVDPGHYKFPGGAEVIDITRHLGFLEGNVIKYVARAGRKSDRLSDLLKARRYLDWAIENEGSK